MIVYESSATTSATDFAASGSFNVTVPNVPNRILLFGFARESRGGDTDLDVGSVTYGGVNMSFLAKGGTGANPNCEVWWIANPKSGTNSLAWGNITTSDNVRYGAVVFSQVSQTLPTNILTTTTITSPQSGTLTGTDSKSLVIDVLGTTGGGMTTLTSGAGQTQMFARVDRPGVGQGFGVALMSYKAGGGSVAMSETYDAGGPTSGGYILFELLPHITPLKNFLKPAPFKPGQSAYGR